MKYYVTIYAEPSSKNPDAWWDIPSGILDDEEQNLKKALTDFLDNWGVFNKTLRFKPMYNEDGEIAGVVTNAYTQCGDKNCYFTLWIHIRKLVEASEEIKKAFKFKD
jgi:hypothetical protein